MIAFPLVSCILSFACAVVMARDAFGRPRPDKVIWAIAFLLFALAAGAEVIGSAFGWTALLARTYYGSAAALVVAYLAIGQLYLLFPAAMRRYGLGITLLITALWLSLVANAPIDPSRLDEEGWRAIDRGGELLATSVVIDSIGTLIIVGGTAWSVWRFRTMRTHRNRMVGCALICVGTLVVASGGSLTRFGNDEYLYIAMSAGVALIFWGVLRSRQQNAPVSLSVDDSPTVLATADQPQVAVKAGGGPVPASGLTFIEALVQRSDAEIDTLCAEWSVPREPGEALSRSDARRAWKLRTMLGPDALTAFDDLPVPARRQVTTLYLEVIGWERPGRDEIAELVTGDAAAARKA